MKIEFVDVSKSYPVKGGKALTALDKVSLTIANGEFLCIHGPSGSGKTTLLNLLAGFAFPSTGKITWDDLPTERHPAFKGGREKLVGFAGQEPVFFPNLTALQNVQIQSIIASSPEFDRTSYLFSAFGLSDILHNLPSAMSGGERRRLSIVRALVLKPQVVVLDEPTAFLDGQWRAKVIDILLDEVRSSGASLVIACHEPLDSLRGARLVEISAGKVAVRKNRCHA